MARLKGFCGCRAYSSYYEAPTYRPRPNTIFGWKREIYDPTKDTRHFFIAFINDRIVQFATKVLARKLVRKM